MFDIVRTLVVSLLVGIATFINPSPQKPTPPKPPVVIATPSSEIATSTATLKISPSIAPVSNNDNINSQLAKDQALKDCLGKVEVFKNTASNMGYQQNEINEFAQIAEYDCNHPSNRVESTPGQKLDQKLNQLQQKTDQLESDMQNQKFWQGICSSRGEQFNALAGAGCR